MYVDTHCHLEMVEGEFPRALVERAVDAGVDTLLTVGVDLASSAECVQTAGALPGVWAVIGIHPNNAIEASDAVMGRLEQLAAHPRVVGIGETGLDYYRDSTLPEQQLAAFRGHVDLAKRLDKTLVIHCRDAHADVVDVLETQGAPERVVFHCFSGGVDLVERCAERGWFMSFAGTVTFRNAPDLRTAAAAAPIELLLTETDAPYLSPHPYRGQTNEPARIPLIAETLGELHGLDGPQMGELTSANARRAFGLPPADGPT